MTSTGNDTFGKFVTGMSGKGEFSYVPLLVWDRRVYHEKKYKCVKMCQTVPSKVGETRVLYQISTGFVFLYHRSRRCLR